MTSDMILDMTSDMILDMTMDISRGMTGQLLPQNSLMTDNGHITGHDWTTLTSKLIYDVST